MSAPYESATSAVGYGTDPVITTTYPEAIDVAQPEPGTADVAKEQAAAVGTTAADAGQHVAGVAKDQASNVVGEAVQQSKDLLGQTKTELQDQAATQQQRVATGIRSLSDELGSMADRSEQDGIATDLVRQAAQRASDIAGWLDQRDPGALVQELKDFARRRPGAFLALAAGAGLAAGRLTRGTVAANSDSTPSPSASPAGPAYSAPVIATPPATVFPDPAYPATVYPDPASPAPAYSDPAYPDRAYSETPFAESTGTLQPDGAGGYIGAPPLETEVRP